MSLEFTDDQSTLVLVITWWVPFGQQAITWADVNPDLYHHMVSLDQNKLIGVILLVLQYIHHNMIVFLQHQLNVDRIWEQY